MEIFIFFALVMLNGIFAMSEIALVTPRRARLYRLVEEGDAAAVAALSLHDEPTRFLSTIQIGITSIGILNGIVGEAVFAEPLAGWLNRRGIDLETSRIVSTGLVVMLITYITIVIGELVPKRIGQFNPEGTARLVARPMRYLAMLAYPFVRLLSLSTDTLLLVLGKQAPAGQSVTAEEINAMI